MKQLIDIMRAAWSQRITWFWPIWIVTTVAAAICAVWVVGQAAAPQLYRANSVSSGYPKMQQRGLPRGAAMALASVFLFLACYVVGMLTWEEFNYYDESMFTLFSLRGHWWPVQIWRQDGRFFPLGQQEFNVLHYFTHTAAGYHALCVVEVLALCAVLLILDDKLPIWARAALVTFALITPAIAISFGGLIYEERNVLLLLVCFALAVKRFSQTQSTAAAVAAVVCAQIMIYYKETAFLLVLGFAAAHLGLRCWRGNRLQYDRLRDRESRLDFCLLSLGLLFLLYYVAVMLPHLSMKYATQRQLPLAELFLAYVKLDLLAWFFTAFLLGRVFLLLRRRLELEPFWDGLAVGGLACFVGYLHLRIVSAYYLAPVDLIAVLYVGRLTILSWKKMHSGTKVATGTLIIIVLLQSVSLSAFRLFERKNVMHAKAEIARLVETQNHSSAETPERLFFPFASPYMIMEFAAYLNYQGIPIEGIASEPSRTQSVVLLSKAIAKDGPCIGYRTIVCHAASEPERGDLVIVMPDDDASRAEISRYRKQGELLLSYEPYPSIPQWLYPLVSHLHIESPLFARKELPGSWLHASVTLCR